MNEKENTRSEQTKVGYKLEEYILANASENVVDVRDNPKYPAADLLISNIPYDIKNSWNTENSSMTKFRKSKNTELWFRKNKNGSYNWHTFPDSETAKRLSENGFMDWCDKPRTIATLEELFG
tara:strand:- start:24 stop:392 length:369 start_codon:yes stop_codon:yes gene_type:complete